MNDRVRQWLGVVRRWIDRQEWIQRHRVILVSSVSTIVLFTTVVSMSLNIVNSGSEAFAETRDGREAPAARPKQRAASESRQKNTTPDKATPDKATPDKATRRNKLRARRAAWDHASASQPTDS